MRTIVNKIRSALVKFWNGPSLEPQEKPKTSNKKYFEGFNTLEVFGPDGKLFTAAHYRSMKHKIVWGDNSRTLKLFLTYGDN